MTNTRGIIVYACWISCNIIRGYSLSSRDYRWVEITSKALTRFHRSAETVLVLCPIGMPHGGILEHCVVSVDIRIVASDTKRRTREDLLYRLARRIGFMRLAEYPDAMPSIAIDRDLDIEKQKLYYSTYTIGIYIYCNRRHDAAWQFIDLWKKISLR